MMSRKGSENDDHYDVLGVSADATESEITAAYYALARRFHPDTAAISDPANRQFKRIVEAFETLANAARRHRYDLQRKRSAASRRSRPITRGVAGLEAVLPVSPEEARNGGSCYSRISRTVKCRDCGPASNRIGTCPTCRSSGEVTEYQTVAVDIPRAVRCGTILTLSHAGGLMRLRVIVRPCW